MLGSVGLGTWWGGRHEGDPTAGGTGKGSGDRGCGCNPSSVPGSVTSELQCLCLSNKDTGPRHRVVKVTRYTTRDAASAVLAHM